VNGFDRPADIIRLSSGNLLVSESAGDRLAVLTENGSFVKYIGAKGRSNGQMVCPLYLCEDSLGRIYVSDYGNRRVDVFDKDGNGLFFFGGKQGSFKGLKGPTGIAIVGDSIFVADNVDGCIYVFDKSGNFIEALVEESTFKKPEAIKKWNDSLIICDQNKIISVDPNTGSTFDFVRTGNAPSRVTTASPDINENVIATDFTANEVYVMSKTQELVGGLFVQIEQIDASSFPKVNVELRVENRHRQPVVGLQQDNFFFTENKRSVSSLQFVGAASNNRHADISLIIDRSTSNSVMTLEMETAVQEIATAMNNEGTLRIISAGAIPVIEYEGSPSGAINFSLGALKNKVSDNVNLDLAFRLATNDLVNAAKKRSIILLSDGNISKNSFTRYGLNEITSYMNNNSIGFSMIQLNQSSIASELNYIIDNTQGDLYYVFRPEGLKGIIDEIINQPYGIYQFSYVSSLQKNFGQSYLPLEIEVFLLNRSGRDETGYFAPLE
jgi:DNA-binding beta-propeller fold protein YncE